MSKALYLSEISGRFIKYEDIQLQAIHQIVFSPKKRIQRLNLNFRTVFLQSDEKFDFLDGPSEVNRCGLFCVL